MSTQPAAQAPGADPARVDPKHYTVEMENQNVRILRIRYGPHEKSVMHGHPSMVGVMLTDGHIRFTYRDGRTEDLIAKAGRVVSLPATEHLPENLGDEAVEALVVELKTRLPRARRRTRSGASPSPVDDPGSAPLPYPHTLPA